MEVNAISMNNVEDECNVHVLMNIMDPDVNMVSSSLK